MLDIVVNPFITMLLAFYAVLGENVFLAIVAFTVIIKMALLPLTLSQQRSMEGMQRLQPELKALQEKYKSEREVLYQKQQELYREHGINPLLGCLPLLIQLPILLGLYRAIMFTLALSPGDLLSLSDRILIPGLDKFVPMDHQFLWLNLSVPDPYLILPVLVVITSWAQQKMLTPAAPTKNGKSDDPADQAAAMTRQMTTFMPLMIGFFSLTYPSGLSVYWVIQNLIGIAQYTVTGKADYARLLGRKPGDAAARAVDEQGRIRKAGISDTHWVEGKGQRQLTGAAHGQDSSNGESSKDSRRERKAKRKASSAKK